MGAKQSSQSDLSSSTSDASPEQATNHYRPYANGTRASGRMKSKTVKLNNHHGSSGNSTPSLRDKIDHMRMGTSLEHHSTPEIEMPDADELERRFLKGWSLHCVIYFHSNLLFMSLHYANIS